MPNATRQQHGHDQNDDESQYVATRDRRCPDRKECDVRQTRDAAIGRPCIAANARYPGSESTREFSGGAVNHLHQELKICHVGAKKTKIRERFLGGSQTLIQQTAGLVDEAQCKDSDVVSVVCDIPDLVNISLVYDKPENIQQAQFSLPFSVACALRFGAARLCDLSSEVIASPKTLALMGLVSKTVDPELSTDEMRKKYPESARVTLILKDGQKFEGFCGEAYGMPGNPFSEADLTDKFSDCLRFAGHNSEMATRIATEILSQNFTHSGRGMSDIVKQVWSLPILDTVLSS